MENEYIEVQPRTEKCRDISPVEMAGYEMSAYFSHFDLAGFTYYDGVKVFRKLKVGTAVRLVAEMHNPYDTKAVAIFYKTHKIGFVPRQENREISKLLNLGYPDVFEAYINRVSPDEQPEHQIGVVVMVNDRRGELKGEEEK